MNKYSVTLYDVIGYIVPGFLFIVFCLFFYSNLSQEFGVLSAFFKINLLWQVLLSYSCGHILQSVSSFAMKVDYSKWWNENNWNRNIKEGIIDSISTKFNFSKDQVQLKKEVINLIEIQINDENVLNTINIYRAYQGFFRALTGFFIFALISLLISFVFKLKLILIYGQKTHLFSSIEILSMSAILIILSIITYKRFRRFTISKIATIVLTAIDFSNSKEKND